MLYQEMKKHILQGLLESGWKAVDDISMQCTTAVAKKDYDTAVGVKTAIAYFTDTPSECCRLGGEYTSKGANILSTTAFLVWYKSRPNSLSMADLNNHLYKLPGELASEDLIAGAKVFDEMAEKKIADSYAVRLLKYRDRAC